MYDHDQEVLKYLAKAPSSNPRLDKYKALLLNTNFRPICYYPLSLWNWQQVMFLMVKGITTGEERMIIVDEYQEEDAIIHSAHDEFQMPSVVSLKEYLKPQSRAAFKKTNVFLRDDFTCQYSRETLPIEDLTYDHVIPKSRGGRTIWTNIVTCSRRINEIKDNKTPKEAKLQLLRKPHEPSTFELLEKGRKYRPNYVHKSWEPFLQWVDE